MCSIDPHPFDGITHADGHGRRAELEVLYGYGTHNGVALQAAKEWVAEEKQVRFFHGVVFSVKIAFHELVRQIYGNT